MRTTINNKFLYMVAAASQPKLRSCS